MNKYVLLVFVLFAISCTSKKQEPKTSDPNLILSKSILQDKIKGGWAGQVIGCTFGGPTEFRFKGSMINDYMPIPWNDTICRWWYENRPGLYDDVYMDLTFVDVFEREGLDAPASAHALAFAHADYALWHANQAARYNILNGIMPPLSGHWLHNPHADDIDFQIEADFAGLMAPGMVNVASEICDKVGHIMNYGDGWYGGVYIAAMYSLAFVHDDVETVVTKALTAIPEESQFHSCISDVIGWYHKFPDDWKRAWFETEKRWSADIGCPAGVFRDFNIDAKLNAAYVVIGLLYGDGDYSKTLELSTRCGQDSDCNPASAGGILGTMLGYSNIPEFWKRPVYEVEDMDFRYTTVSLNDVYEMGMKHALLMLERNGASMNGEEILLQEEVIEPVELEVGFENHYPVERKTIEQDLTLENPEITVEFKGNGFVLSGGVRSSIGNAHASIEMRVDGGDPEYFNMPTAQGERRLEIGWRYQLPDEKHNVIVRLMNPQKGVWVETGDLLVYSSTKIENTWKSHQ